MTLDTAATPRALCSFKNETPALVLLGNGQVELYHREQAWASFWSLWLLWLPLRHCSS